MGRQSHHLDSKRADKEAGVPRGANIHPVSWRWQVGDRASVGGRGNLDTNQHHWGAVPIALTCCLREGNGREESACMRSPLGLGEPGP